MGMRSCELLHLMHIPAIIVRVSRNHMGRYPTVIMPHLVKALLLALHGCGFLDPPIVVHECPNARHTQLVVGPFPKPLCVLKRENSASRFDHANFIAVPFAARPHVIVRTIKVTVGQQQSIDAFAMQVYLHGLLQIGMPVFVQDLISLDVNAPIRIRRDSRQSLIRFLCENTPPFSQRIIPNGLNDANLIGFNRLDQRERRII